jgi:hypothetical protein
MKKEETFFFHPYILHPLQFIRKEKLLFLIPRGSIPKDKAVVGGEWILSSSKIN